MQYLRGTISHGLLLCRDSPISLHAYSNADWVDNKDDRTFTSAYVIFLGSNVISWCSRKQRTVARSSTEAEYRAIAHTTAEVIWISSLLCELLISPSTPPTIYCDNISATYLCSNPVFHSWMKHIAIDFHFVREKVQSGKLRVSHVVSSDQLADSLIKPLSRTRFTMLSFPYKTLHEGLSRSSVDTCTNWLSHENPIISVPVSHSRNSTGLASHETFRQNPSSSSRARAADSLTSLPQSVHTTAETTPRNGLDSSTMAPLIPHTRNSPDSSTIVNLLPHTQLTPAAPAATHAPPHLSPPAAPNVPPHLSPTAASSHPNHTDCTINPATSSHTTPIPAAPVHTTVEPAAPIPT
ncbi:hypothetical protein LWI29_001900 [Acer saccharum]|uniref:Uncharacterized protein n=1 Tax=Acer saccharum TaxID=4024 RepID=A0AA39SQU1_ACESA|nr:hypothetical protein LWI29_001900 [Acer saccharum]